MAKMSEEDQIDPIVLYRLSFNDDKYYQLLLVRWLVSIDVPSQSL